MSMELSTSEFKKPISRKEYLEFIEELAELNDK